MLSLNAAKRDLVLPQFNLQDFVDSPLELYPLEEWKEGGLGEELKESRMRDRRKICG